MLNNIKFQIKMTQKTYIKVAIVLLIFTAILRLYYIYHKPSKVPQAGIIKKTAAIRQTLAKDTVYSNLLPTPSFDGKQPDSTREVDGQFVTNGVLTDKANTIKNISINQSKSQNFFFDDSLNIHLLHIFDQVRSVQGVVREYWQPYLSREHASILSGMVFGGSNQLPSELKTNLKVIGMLHVVSASGYNVALISSLASHLVSRLTMGRLLKLGVILLMIFLYIVCAGSSLPLIRAGLSVLMQSVASTLFRRQYHGLYTLLISAVILEIVEPRVWLNLSFQLTFAATFGIIIFADSFTAVIKGILSAFFNLLGVLKLSGYKIERSSSLLVLSVKSFVDDLVSVVAVSGAAQIFTTPIVIFYFGEMSLISIIANFALLWLTPIVTVFGLIFFLTAWFLPSIFSSFFVIIIWFPVELFIVGASFFGSISGSLLKLSSYRNSYLTLTLWFVFSFILFTAFRLRKGQKIRAGLSFN